MKKNPKQIAAIIALVLIVLLIISFFVSALTTTNGNNFFFITFFLIIAVPILSWLFIFLYGRVKGKHTIAELFPKEWQSSEPELDKNPDSQNFSEAEITEAMENSKTDASSK